MFYHASIFSLYGYVVCILCRCRTFGTKRFGHSQHCAGSIYIVMMIPVSSLATTANSLVSNTIGSGKLPQVMPLIGKISRMSFLIMLVSVGIIVLFKEQVLAIYTNEVQLINESVLLF